MWSGGWPAFIPSDLWVATLALLFVARMGHSYEFQGASSRRHSFISQHPNHLQVIIDIRYQYAIMSSLSRHNSSACPPQLWRSQIPALSERRVPHDPCSPAS